MDTTEHLLPLSEGGNNTLLNKKRCCSNCNQWRSSKNLISFRNEIKNILNNKTLMIKIAIKKGYNKQDLEYMIENLDYWYNYIITSKDKLKKKKLI